MQLAALNVIQVTTSNRKSAALPRNIYALLVGINDDSPNIGKLSGCLKMLIIFSVI